MPTKAKEKWPLIWKLSYKMLRKNEWRRCDPVIAYTAAEATASAASALTKQGVKWTDFRFDDALAHPLAKRKHVGRLNNHPEKGA